MEMGGSGQMDTRIKDSGRWIGTGTRSEGGQINKWSSDMMADFLDWKGRQERRGCGRGAAKPEDRASAKKFAKYARADAARARGWRRVRAAAGSRQSTNGTSGSAGGAIDDWD